VTRGSTNKSLRNHQTYIRALGKTFHSDIEALAHVTAHFKTHSGKPRHTNLRLPRHDDMANYLGQKGHLEFHIKGVTDQAWNGEPKHTLGELCHRLCDMLEQTYDEIIISHSGGTDSDTIAQLFLKRGTRNITLMRRSQDLWPGDNVGRTETHVEPLAKWLDKHTEQATKKEYARAFKDLGWKMKFVEQLQPYDEKQYERSLLNREFLCWENDYANISSWAQNSGGVFTAKGRKVCFIEGLEKPVIVLHKGWYCFRMHHDSQWWGQPLAPPEVDRVWFWMNDLVPEIIQKLAYLKAMEMKNIFREQKVTPTRDEVAAMNRASHPCRQRLNRAMSMKGLTLFHDKGETNYMERLNVWFGPLEFQPTPGEGFDWKHWDITARSKKEHATAIHKMKIRDQFYDEVITKQVHKQFLLEDTKTVTGIPTRTIPLIPVDSE